MKLRACNLVCCLAALILSSEAPADLSFPGERFATGAEPNSLAVADLNGDSVLDFVTANFDGFDVSVFWGNGDGTFQSAKSFATGSGPHFVAVADLDGDTVPDLVTANRYSYDVCVLLGNGDGSFQDAGGRSERARGCEGRR